MTGRVHEVLGTQVQRNNLLVLIVHELFLHHGWRLFEFHQTIFLFRGGDEMTEKTCHNPEGGIKIDEGYRYKLIVTIGTN